MSHDIQGYSFTSSDKLFFDANILIYLDGPIANAKQPYQNIYANAFQRMINAQSRLFVDSTVVSEFVNRYLRLEHKRLLKTQHPQIPKEFKPFRNTPTGNALISTISAVLKRRLRRFEVLAMQADKGTMSRIIDEFDNSKGDINDCIIAAICRQNNFSLVTHDGDMGSFGLNLISANAKVY
jgi:predicted nucleic acid-binding protein